MTAADRILESNRQRMAALLSELTPCDGLWATALDGVQLKRSARSVPRTPVLYEPSIYVVASGLKRGYVGDRRFVYDRNQYLVLSAPLPFECEVETAHDEPLLAVSIRMEIRVISELAAGMDLGVGPMRADGVACVASTPLEPALSDAVVRLLECLRSPADSSILGPAIQREIAYRVLCGPRGIALLTMLGRSGQAARIHAILRRMHARYAEPLDVGRMAADAGMSVSTLHHLFKAITSTSPIQYLKALRLHNARLLMLNRGMGVADAADRVGYQSASQFSREFRRLFGRSPIEELRCSAGPDDRAVGRRALQACDALSLRVSATHPVGQSTDRFGRLSMPVPSRQL